MSFYYKKTINSCEESIEYKNNTQILLNIENWYLMKYNNSRNNANSYVYHHKCQQDLQRTPFLHWRTLRCRGCGVLPPNKIAGVYSLHNMEYIQQGDKDVKT